jgi:hypothetical protein
MIPVVWFFITSCNTRQASYLIQRSLFNSKSSSVLTGFNQTSFSIPPSSSSILSNNRPSWASTMPSTHARPRKGGSTARAWICCVCYYHNKTGKFRNCQNPNKEDCEGVERQRELTQSGRSWKEKTEVEGNHERCDECWPLQGAQWQDANGKGPGRRW